MFDIVPQPRTCEWSRLDASLSPNCCAAEAIDFTQYLTEAADPTETAHVSAQTDEFAEPAPREEYRPIKTGVDAATQVGIARSTVLPALTTSRSSLRIKYSTLTLKLHPF